MASHSLPLGSDDETAWPHFAGSVMFLWPPLVCAVSLLEEEIPLQARRFVVFLSQRNSDESDFWWRFGARTKETKRVFFLRKGNSSKKYQCIWCQEYRTSINTQQFCPRRNTYSLFVCLHSGSTLSTFKMSKTLQKKGIEHVSLHMYLSTKTGLKTERGLIR